MKLEALYVAIRAFKAEAKAEANGQGDGEESEEGIPEDPEEEE